MLEQVLLALKALFLVLIYVFVWRVVRTAARDLRVPQESFVLGPAQAAALGLGAQSARATPARLTIVRSPTLAVGAPVDVGPVPVTIGRSAENDVALADDGFASGRHARLESAPDGVWIVDLGSTNGTFVNGERIDGRRLLGQGDVVLVGDTELRREG